MSKIVSVSRRTDIPAFYGDWFINRLKDGFAGYVNPFGGQKYIVPLKPEDVTCFVFWSKNYKPFIDKLKIIEEMGYKFYFNYTITGLPDIFECNLVERETAIESLKDLSNLYSPRHINWRYDPIIITDSTDLEFHIKNFDNIASKLEGYVERCYFSFALQYGKVKRSFDKFQNENNVIITDPDINFKNEVANELANIADKYGIKMLTCCNDTLLSQKIGKAHCVDGNIIEELFYKNGFKHGGKPTRKDCGCTDSVDVGAYDTCPHGCVYCYANMNKTIAETRFQNHDANSVFLGYNKVESDEWVEEINKNKPKNPNKSLFDFT